MHARNFDLAVLTSLIGEPSQTFIRRHLSDLCPGRTIAILTQRSRVQRAWHFGGPTYDLTQSFNTSMRWRTYRAVLRLTGHPEARMPPGARIDRLWDLCRFIKRHGARVILAEWLSEAVKWIDVRAELGLPIFAHAHGWDVTPAMLRSPEARRYLELRNAAGIITMSERSRRQLIDFGFDADKVHHVPYGVDVPDAPPEHPPTETVTCAAVGRMVAKKAPILLLESFRRAAAECPNLRLEYVGGGELLPAAQHFVQVTGLADKVTLHGTQPSDFVADLFKRADLFVQHSVVDPITGDEEGLPVAILEAMAAALPVVATRHAGIPEEVEHGTTGLLVDEGDCDAMSRHMVALTRDASLRRQFGCAGWQRAREHFAWPIERARLLNILGLAEQP